MVENIVNYIDEKGNKIKNFDLLTNFMWRRAFYVVKENFKENEKIMVIDPCAGGGKLISCMNKDWTGVGYEANYAPFMYAKYMLDQNNYDVSMVNQPFEFHFTTPALPEFHLVISIPYTDRQINTNYEKDATCLQMKNYAYYIMNKSLDILQDGGYGVFAIPRELMDSDTFQEEIKCIAGKASILSTEGYENYVILILKKEK